MIESWECGSILWAGRRYRNMKKHKLPASVRAALNELKHGSYEIYGPKLHGMYLYGSYARGDYAEGSDVDVLVALEGDVKPSKEIDRLNDLVSDIDLRYDLLISVFPVPAKWLEERHSPLFANVRKEGVLL
jgi:predicted nucleotidyltransferase